MESFNELEMKYEAMIWKIIHSLHIYKNHEEFYQTGLIALWEASCSYDAEKGSFSTFAYAYIKGRILTELTKRRKYEEACTAASDEEFWEFITDDSMDTRLEGDDILDYCARLTEPQKKWVLYTALADLSIKQIAEVEHVSVSAVKAWRKGARKKIVEDIKGGKIRSNNCAKVIR